MNIFALEIFEEHDRCTLYTVRKLDPEEDHSETERFFRKFYAIEEYQDNIKEILALLDYIGDMRGANKYLFRDEAKAHALPKNEKSLCVDLTMDFADFPLRLYCLRVCDEILVLFNGGIKDAGTAQESKASMSFYEAQEFSQRINDAFRTREISIRGNKIVSDYSENIEL